MKNYRKAINDCSRALELNPGSVAAYNNRGLALYALGEVRKALSDFTRAITVNPMYPDSYRHRGIVYFETGNSVKAMEDFQKATRLDDEKTEILLRGLSQRNRTRDATGTIQ